MSSRYAPSSNGAERNGQAGIEDLREKYWQQEQSAYDRLMSLAEKPHHLTSVFSKELLEAAFSPETEPVLVCMDERIRLPQDSRPIGIAGGGIFLKEGLMTNLVHALQRNGVRHITSHDECGACSLYCDFLRQERGRISDPDHEGTLFAEELAGEVSGRAERIHRSSMSGHPNFHHARCMTIDNTGFFNPSVLGKEYPSSLFLSAPYYPTAKRLALEAQIGVNVIAMGEHGMGWERFTDDQPMAIAIVNDPFRPSYNTQVLNHILHNLSQTRRALQFINIHPSRRMVAPLGRIL